MNHFQLSFKERLQEWYNLRENIKYLPLDQQCTQTDNWWQKTPLVNRYLHAHFIEEWPMPWDLLNDNEYCQYARALGMIYTLHLVNVTNIKLYEAKDQDGIDVVLVIVNDNYVLNYWPNTVNTNQIKDFQLGQRLNIAHLLDKIK